MRVPFLSAWNEVAESRAAVARIGLAEAEATLSEAKARAAMANVQEVSWSKFVDDTDAEKGWTLLSTQKTAHTTEWEQERDTPEYLDELRSWARWVARYDPIARSVIGNYLRYIWGLGPSVQPNDDNQQHKDVWKKFEVEQKWNKFGRDAVRMLYRDGEIFVMDRGPSFTPRFRLFDPGRIREPTIKDSKNSSFGIKTDPKDVTKVEGYWWLPGGDVEEFIKAKDMIHIKINADPWDKRGRSALENPLEDIRDYRKFRRNRAALHWVRTLWALHQRTRGPQGSAAAAKDQMTVQPGTDALGREHTKQMKPGTMVFSNTEPPTMLSPNLQASDAFHDAREIKLQIAAGQGMSEVWVTADGQNANYATAQVAESPSVRMIEGEQKMFSEQFITPIYERVIFSAIEAGDIALNSPQKFWDAKSGTFKEESKEADLTASIVWPGLIHRNIREEARALDIMVKNGTVSPRTSSTQMGYDYDSEQENILRDQGEGQPEESKPKRSPADVPDEEQREELILDGLEAVGIGVEKLTEAIGARVEKDKGEY